MTHEIFIYLFLVLEIITPLIVEGLKETLKGLGMKYNATIMCLIVAVIMSLFTGAFAFEKFVEYQRGDWIYIVALVVSNWLGSTLGYDKVKEALKRIEG